MKISLKLLAGYFVIVGLAAYFVLRFFVAEIKPSVRTTIEEGMVDTANMLAEFAAQERKSPTPFAVNGLFAQAVKDYRAREVNARINKHDKDSLELRVYATNEKGIVLFDSENLEVGKDFSQWRDVYLTLKGEYGARSTRMIPGDDTSSIYHVGAAIKEGEKIVGVLSVAKPVSAISPIVSAAERQILNKGAWLMVASLAIGIWVSWRLQRSVKRLVNYARSLARGEKSVRPGSSTQELDQLAQAMQHMRDQLDGKAYVESYAQALAHELKSPLTALQAHAELLQDAKPDQQKLSAQRIQEQSERMRDLLEKILTLTKLERLSSRPANKPIGAQALLAQVISEHADHAAQQAVRLTNSDAPPVKEVIFEGDPDLLKLALSNLVSNAIAFSPQGAQVSCSFSVDSNDSQVRFHIQDQGTGIDADSLDKAFTRYYSTARPRSGQRSTGLGLALSQEIARLHGGRVSLRNTSPGCLAELIITKDPNS